MLLLAAYVLLGYLLWRSWRHDSPRRWRCKPATPLLPGITLAIFLPLTGLSRLCVVLLAILADQSTINSEALINSLTMASVQHSSLCSCYCWLEWGPQRRQLWLWLPILLPALPLVAGQYTLALWLNLDGSWTAVVGDISAVGNAVDAVYPATRLAAEFNYG